MEETDRRQASLPAFSTNNRVVLSCTEIKDIKQLFLYNEAETASPAGARLLKWQTISKQRKYIPLNPSQAEAINNLGAFFEPVKESNQVGSCKDDELSNRYVRATDLLTSSLQKAIEAHAEKIELGFKKFSAY